MPDGCEGNILRVNPSSKAILARPLGHEIARKYIDGVDLAAKII